jgi:hypothetical protein
MASLPFGEAEARENNRSVRITFVSKAALKLAAYLVPFLFCCKTKK